MFCGALARTFFSLILLLEIISLLQLEGPANVAFTNKLSLKSTSLIFLVWCAISKSRVLRIYIGHVKGKAAIANVYAEKCLPKMHQFRSSKHTFWIRAKNPPNVPQARPIEDFCSLLTRKIHGNGWEAQNKAKQRRRI